MSLYAVIKLKVSRGPPFSGQNFPGENHFLESITEELVILGCVILSQCHRVTGTDRWTDMLTITNMALAHAKLLCFYGPQCRSLIYFVSALGLLSFIRVAESIKA